MMCYFLNTHQRIFIANETDTLYYVYSKGATQAHPDDNPENLNKPDPGLSVRARRPKYYLPYEKLEGSDRDKVFQDLLWTMTQPAEANRDGYPNKNVNEIRYIGDKKPTFVEDPAARKWLYGNFADAYIIHLVRDPRNCIASMAGLGWADGNIGFLTDYWIRLEQNALALPWQTHIIRYEDVCADPEAVMAELCFRLGLDPDERDRGMKRGMKIFDETYARQARRLNPQQVPVTPRMRDLARLYGYDY